MQSTLTHVDPGVFREMKTDQGITVDELCQKGAKVLLYFAFSVGCSFCQARIDDLFNMYEVIIKIGVVPILLYNDDTQDFKEFIEKNKRSDNYDVFLTMQQKEFKKIFKIQPFTLKTAYSINFFSEIFRLLKRGIMVRPDLVEKVPKQFATAFVIYQNKIISEYRPKTQDERFDFTKIVIDPDNYGITVTQSSPLECTYVPKRKRVERRFNVVKKEVKNSSIDISNDRSIVKKNSNVQIIESDDLSLKNILSNDYYRQYFKMYLIREFAVENLLFWEEVQNYKKLEEKDRKERCLKILKTFFEPDSIHEINTTKQNLDEIKEKVENPDSEIFKNIEFEVQQDCFLDAFVRMKKSDVWKDMISKKRKTTKSILL